MIYFALGFIAGLLVAIVLIAIEMLFKNQVIQQIVGKAEKKINNGDVQILEPLSPMAEALERDDDNRIADD